jgi:hypothetical protein
LVALEAGTAACWVCAPSAPAAAALAPLAPEGRGEPDVAATEVAAAEEPAAPAAPAAPPLASSKSCSEVVPPHVSPAAPGHAVLQSLADAGVLFISRAQ